MSREQSKRTVLVAGMGTSPAVLTETVWALGHQKKAKESHKESPAALTTAQKALMNSFFAEVAECTWGANTALDEKMMKRCLAYERSDGETYGTN